MIKVGIIGASGYAGSELIRYLNNHPKAKITYLASKSLAGKSITEAYPCFRGIELPICEEYDVDRACKEADFFFQTQGNGVGMSVAPELLKRGKKLIDVPADFRIKNPKVYEKFYKMEHTAQDILREAVYAVADIHKDKIKTARVVANPGCYATSVILACAPLMGDDAFDHDTIIADSASGVSGAGRSKLSVSGLYCEVNEGFKAYGVATHRHRPEIEQELELLAGKKVTIAFTPHLAPMNRGILTTAYIRSAKKWDADKLLDRYAEYYSDSPFVIVLERGQQPCTKNVFGTNFAHIGVVFDEHTSCVIVTCAIDNMGKGAAGQAVQNFNLMNGFDPETGLMSTAVYP
ncbi:MAG: N-acetyl-gamma-glutamyl-phosphate reductase [Abditibacteriota bacterium]|nr:N-acetyl-gamma-glutamyl-phosphate reductase [Abditibacteriota bacterium]MBP5093193.1 N-acetyl-gamma-glutamyl-phosphate reductase [Abditibacteriota bacterium]MBP5738157.1 N-acetyl-gamma-glutamyl-phosphate reductase [Abditibacteriota bacterium]